MANRQRPVSNRGHRMIESEEIIKVSVRFMDYEHIKKILRYRARHLYDAESLEVLEQLKKNNPKYENVG